VFSPYIQYMLDYPMSQQSYLASQLQNISLVRTANSRVLRIFTCVAWQIWRITFMTQCIEQIWYEWEILQHCPCVARQLMTGWESGRTLKEEWPWVSDDAKLWIKMQILLLWKIFPFSCISITMCRSIGLWLQTCHNFFPLKNNLFGFSCKPFWLIEL
jgi:hypothetical protein